jgi:hypothetical protein
VASYVYLKRATISGNPGGHWHGTGSLSGIPGTGEITDRPFSSLDILKAFSARITSEFHRFSHVTDNTQLYPQKNQREHQKI